MEVKWNIPILFEKKSSMLALEKTWADSIILIFSFPICPYQFYESYCTFQALFYCSLRTALSSPFYSLIFFFEL